MTLLRAETVVLALIGLLLAVVTINDDVRQRKIDVRLHADQQTWRHYTRHDYKNVSVDQLLLGITSAREVVCGNTVPGPPQQRTQICLIVEGPVQGGLREVTGGWYLPAFTEQNVKKARYGCFGARARGFCPQ